MAKRLLPIGIQTFREIRESGYYYVDKTGYALQLVREGKHYFLSRPRRFGKSLFLDTLKELFQGRQDLFEGLYVYDRWDWSLHYPVVKLSFGKGNFKEPGYIHKNVMARLGVVEEQAAVDACHDTGPERFDHLLRTLHHRTGRRVVVLVDEYDKPMLDALSEPDVARANRDYLRGLYSVIKDCDAHIRFCFLTGVSKFSKASLFSGLNNLIHITLEPPFSAVCGYTEEDLDGVFRPELEGLDRQRIRDWYNGYSWGGADKVYNPFDLLLLFRKRLFKAWWFETGTPRFLVETLVERGVRTPTLDGMLTTDELLGTFDIEDIATEALLFQTGYLTVVGKEWDDDTESLYYRLGYPNREVRKSLNLSLLRHLVQNRSLTTQPAGRLLKTGNFTGLRKLLHAVFAGIPGDWHRRNEIARYEGYYASVFYSYFTALGMDVRVEDSSSAGRLDMAVQAGGRVFLFEFKIVERTQPGEAMEQLKARGYADKYRHLGSPVYLVGVDFSVKTRNVTTVQGELA